MTLVIAATGRESIWIAADRRLSEHGKPVADDAIKILRLERSDDVALLAYSGLGRTPDGIQPSDWMNAVLRDRNEALVRSLEILVRAIDTQIPKYMFRVPGIGNSAHVVLAPAFVSEKPTLYTLKLDIDAKAKQHHTSVEELVGGPPRFARIETVGSGRPFVRNSDIRQVARLVSRHEKGKVSAFSVARQFAKIIVEVSGKESTVGPNCIVAWQYRRNGPIKHSPSFQAFNGLDKATGDLTLPWNGNGMDIGAIANAVLPLMVDVLARARAGGKDERPDEAAINEALSKLPSGPDEKL
jgi:hypothetical protein